MVKQNLPAGTPGSDRGPFSQRWERNIQRIAEYTPGKPTP